MRHIWQLLTTVVFLSLPAVTQANDCSEVLGAYLTTKVDRTGVDRGIQGRTILTLASGGTATMTDSAQGGIAGYQAFSMMQGEWDCVSVDGTSHRIQVTLVDFSYPDDANPDATVARVDLSAVIDSARNTVQGKTTVNIFPLFDDPFSDQEPAVTVEYDFDGQRIRITPLSD